MASHQNILQPLQPLVDDLQTKAHPTEEIKIKAPSNAMANEPVGCTNRHFIHDDDRQVKRRPYESDRLARRDMHYDRHKYRRERRSPSYNRDKYAQERYIYTDTIDIQGVKRLHLHTDTIDL